MKILYQAEDGKIFDDEVPYTHYNDLKLKDLLNQSNFIIRKE